MRPERFTFGVETLLEVANSKGKKFFNTVRNLSTVRYFTSTLTSDNDNDRFEWPVSAPSNLDTPFAMSTRVISAIIVNTILD